MSRHERVIASPNLVIDGCNTGKHSLPAEHPRQIGA